MSSKDWTAGQTGLALLAVFGLPALLLGLTGHWDIVKWIGIGMGVLIVGILLFFLGAKLMGHALDSNAVGPTEEELAIDLLHILDDDGDC